MEPTTKKKNSMKKLNSWFEIDEKQYMWYILQGYHIFVGESFVCWMLNGKRHRIDGPAYIWEDGPAYTIWADGTQEWWVDGERINTLCSLES